MCTYNLYKIYVCQEECTEWSHEEEGVCFVKDECAPRTSEECVAHVH